MASSRRNSTKASSQAPIKLTSKRKSPRKSSARKFNDDGMLRGYDATNALLQHDAIEERDLNCELSTANVMPLSPAPATPPLQVSLGQTIAESIARPLTAALARQEHTQGVAIRVTPSKTKSTASRPSNWDILSSPEIANTTPQKLDPRPEPIIAPNGATSGSAAQSHEPLGLPLHLTGHQTTPSRAENSKIRRRKVYDEDHGLFLRTHSNALAFRPASNSIQPTRNLKNTLPTPLNHLSNAPTPQSKHQNPLATRSFSMPTLQPITFAQHVQEHSDPPNTNATTHNRIPFLTSPSGPSPLQRCFYEAYRLPADLQHLSQPMPSPSSHLGSRRTPASPPLPSPKANGGSQLNQTSQLQSSGTPTKSQGQGRFK
jgi:hypothetical protein